MRKPVLCAARASYDADLKKKKQAKKKACEKCSDTGACAVSVNDAGEITARIRCDCPKGKSKRGKGKVT